MTPEQLENARLPLELADIPSRSLFLCDAPQELFHYTSLDGACGIIQTKSLHLTKVAYLNDLSELSLAIELFRHVAQEMLPSIAAADLRRLISKTADQLTSFARTNICVASFCEDRDLLSQWKSYGKAGRGVTLGFSGQKLSEINQSGWANLMRCVYDRNDHYRIAQDLVGLLMRSYDVVTRVVEPHAQERALSEIIGYFNTTFLRVAPVLKNRHFAEEKEWRLITTARDSRDPKYRSIVSNSRSSEYYVYEFVKSVQGTYDFLLSVGIGPTPAPELISGPVKVLCDRNDVHVGAFWYSQIPFRS
jgi:hypothetical protein